MPAIKLLRGSKHQRTETTFSANLLLWVGVTPSRKIGKVSWLVEKDQPPNDKTRLTESSALNSLYMSCSLETSTWKLSVMPPNAKCYMVE